ncbi:MAG: ABC transporter permease [Gemmatimonadaceae bacterium]|jgi:peptide/nickel transport system permease protein|nr:ABC transporter permease [Gemmatimonadaceae bacterium]
MGALLVRRVGAALPLVLLVSVAYFALLHALPGGPLAAYLSSPNVRPEDLARLERALGLDRPLPEQYLRWLFGVVRGDWGYSFVDGRPVFARLLERVPATLELVGAGLSLALLGALPLAVVSAERRDRTADHAIRAASAAGLALPVFWTALLAQLVFAIWLGWLPSSGRSGFASTGLGGRLQYLVLPAFVLAISQVAAWSRYLRATLVGTLAESWVTAARARGGAPWRVRLRHALRPSLVPFLTVALLDAALLVSGAVVTESVFAWPGLGALFTDALARRDYPVLMGFLLFGAFAVIAANVIADVAQGWLDPRVRERLA